MHPPEGPPIWAALYFFPLGIPPPMSKMICRILVPMATSTRPVRLTLPDSAKTFVPLLPAVPTEANHCAPLANSRGRLARVSTLLMTVGLSNRPRTAGKGGRGRGMPRLPSMLLMSAVSSPQTNAPAPCLMMMSRLNPLPSTLCPNSPYSLACAIAAMSLLIARGYSARMYT